MALFWKMRVGPRFEYSNPFDFSAFTVGQAFPGALVGQFTAVDSVESCLEVSVELGDRMATSTFEGTITGVNAPRSLLRPRACIVVETASTPGGTYTVALVGWIRQARIEDDAKGRESFTVKFSGSNYILGQEYAKTTRIGPLNAAQGAESFGDSQLRAHWKDRWATDDEEAEPDLGPSKSVDGDTNTGWVADRMVGPSRSNTSTNRSGFEVVYANPPVDAPRGVSYIQMLNLGWAGRTLRVWDTQEHRTYELVTAGVADFNGDKNDRCVLAESDAAFSAAYPSAQPAQFYATSVSDNADTRVFFKHIRPEVGQLAIHGTTGVVQTFTWGDWAAYVAATTPPGGWDAWVVKTATPDLATALPNYPVMLNLSANTWAQTALNDPGRLAQNAVLDDVWVGVYTASPGLKLRDAIASQPGDGLIYLVNDAGQGTTEGLPASGQVIIEGAIYTYNNRTATTIHVTGTSGSGAWAHPQNAKVYAYITDPADATRKVACDAYYASKVRVWMRDDSRWVPQTYRIRLSTQRARLPSDSRHEDDYEFSYDRSGNFVQTTDGRWADQITLAAATPIKTVLIEFGTMTDRVGSAAYGRPRLDEIEVEVTAATLAQTVVVADGTDRREFAGELVKNATHFPDACVVYTSPLSSHMPATVTEYAPAWVVLSDLADYANLFVKVRRDGKIEIAGGNWTESGSATPIETWTRDELQQFYVEKRETGEVAQVVQPYVLPDGTKGSAAYPTTPTHDGEIRTFSEQVFATSTAAEQSAQREYSLNRYPYTVYMRLVNGSWNHEPGQVHQLSWAYRTSGTETPLFLVQRADHYIEDGAHNTVLVGVEVNRTQA